MKVKMNKTSFTIRGYYEVFRYAEIKDRCKKLRWQKNHYVPSRHCFWHFGVDESPEHGFKWPVVWCSQAGMLYGRQPSLESYCPPVTHPVEWKKRQAPPRNPPLHPMPHQNPQHERRSSAEMCGFFSPLEAIQTRSVKASTAPNAFIK